MGILQALKAFAHALVVVHNNHPESLQTKLKHLACFGLLEDEIQELIINKSSLLCYSIDKMKERGPFGTHCWDSHKYFCDVSNFINFKFRECDQASLYCIQIYK